jgi:hypothetical protein
VDGKLIASNKAPLADQDYQPEGKLIIFNHTFTLNNFSKNKLAQSVYWQFVNHGLTIKNSKIIFYSSISGNNATLYKLNELKNIAEKPAGGKFVFAHIVSPHWPHVFGPNGESVHEKPDSISGYRNQVIFLNKQIVPILQEILAKSQTPPIIILQGDHGSVIESPERRMAILNAYYLPEDGRQALYGNISPVNTFRVIFNEVFGDNQPLLEDRAFYSSYELPHNYQMVPNDKSACN